MPTPAPARPAPAGLPPSRCPDCGEGLAAAAGAVVRCGCSSEVGVTLLDLEGRRQPMMAVFSTTTEPACAACGGSRRRVLVGSGVGVVCDGCGVIVRRARPVQVAPEGERAYRGLVAELAVVVVVVVAAASGVRWLWGLTAG